MEESKILKKERIQNYKNLIRICKLARAHGYGKIFITDNKIIHIENSNGTKKCIEWYSPETARDDISYEDTSFTLFKNVSADIDSVLDNPIRVSKMEWIDAGDKLSLIDSDNGNIVILNRLVDSDIEIKPDPSNEQGIEHVLELNHITKIITSMQSQPYQKLNEHEMETILNKFQLTLDIEGNLIAINASVFGNSVYIKKTIDIEYALVPNYILERYGYQSDNDTFVVIFRQFESDVVIFSLARFLHMEEHN